MQCRVSFKLSSGPGVSVSDDWRFGNFERFLASLSLLLEISFDKVLFNVNSCFIHFRVSYNWRKTWKNCPPCDACDRHVEIRSNVQRKFERSNVAYEFSERDRFFNKSYKFAFCMEYHR